MSVNQPGYRPPAAPMPDVRNIVQSEQFGQDETGRTVDGIKVSFTLANGQPGSVFIPRTRYTVENVQAAIRDYAGRMQAVQNLASG